MAACDVVGCSEEHLFETVLEGERLNLCAVHAEQEAALRFDEQRNLTIAAAE